MPCYIRKLNHDGELQPVDYTADSLASAVQFEPDDGIYTVANTFNTDQTLKFNDHLDRMIDSAERVGIALTLDRAMLKRALRQMIAEAGYGDVRFRVTVPRDGGAYFILSLEPFTPLPEAIIAAGVKVVTAPDSARQEAAAKTTDWMHKRRAITEALPADAYDAILLDADGRLMEGLGANFYAVSDGELWTAGDGVLPGIAQKIVFEVAPDVIAVRREGVHLRDVTRLDEAFITSSSRGIVPVVAIDDVILGDGRPGPITQELLRRYRAWVAANLESL